MNNLAEMFEDFVQRYGPSCKHDGFAPGESGPERFVEEVLGIETLDPWQRAILRDFGRGERRISIRSCHGPGKTATVAWCVLYMLIFRFPQKTVATAPTRGQLFDALFAECMTWFRRLPPELQDAYVCKSDRIELKSHPDESFFSARTARRESPEALQGVHSENVLLVADEASGVDEAIFEAAVGSMSGYHATTILASNPTKTSGFFYDTQHKLKRLGPTDDRPGTWKCYHIAAHDSPRVTEDFIHDVAARYGEDSNAYRIRVLGEFPRSDDDTLIPFYLVEGAATRDIVPDEGVSCVWGLDVARFGDDVSALCQRTNRGVDWVRQWKGLDTMSLVGRVKAAYESMLPSEQPSLILVDVIGLGAGVLDRLRELDLPARGINVGESAALTDQYRNLRAELWDLARMWLAEQACYLAQGTEQLQSELVIPKYTYTSSGKLQLESKDDMKKRGHKSPNHADAFVLTFASNALKARSGRKADIAWSAPLTRNIPGIV